MIVLWRIGKLNDIGICHLARVQHFLILLGIGRIVILRADNNLFFINRVIPQPLAEHAQSHPFPVPVHPVDLLFGQQFSVSNDVEVICTNNTEKIFLV